MQKSKHPLVVIEWRDACNYFDGGTIEDCLTKSTCVVQTCGFLVRKDNKIVITASEINEHGHFRQISVIPRSLVTKIRQA